MAGLRRHTKHFTPVASIKVLPNIVIALLIPHAVGEN